MIDNGDLRAGFDASKQLCVCFGNVLLVRNGSAVAGKICGVNSRQNCSTLITIIARSSILSNVTWFCL